MRFLFLALLLMSMNLLMGCVPASGATILVGEGLQIADLEAVETIVEKLKFQRVWVEPKGRERTPRLDGPEKTESFFEGRSPRGFDVTVRLEKKSGKLTLLFVERDSRLSERGTQLLTDLATEIKRHFGAGVTIQRSTSASRFDFAFVESFPA